MLLKKLPHLQQKEAESLPVLVHTFKVKKSILALIMNRQMWC